MSAVWHGLLVITLTCGCSWSISGTSKTWPRLTGLTFIMITSLLFYNTENIISLQDEHIKNRKCMMETYKMKTPERWRPSCPKVLLTVSILAQMTSNGAMSSDCRIMSCRGVRLPNFATLGQTVQPWERRLTDRQTDWHTDRTDFIPSTADAGGNYIKLSRQQRKSCT